MMINTMLLSCWTVFFEWTIDGCTSTFTNLLIRIVDKNTKFDITFFIFGYFWHGLVDKFIKLLLIFIS
jgi:hypothetical protein